MGQNIETGRAANDWGKSTARKIADELGAKMLNTRSNECEFEGHRCVIKCAKQKTTQIGLSYKMMERLDRVVAAFQLEDGSFEIYFIEAAKIADQLTDSRSKSHQKGVIGMAQKSFILKHGACRGQIRI